MKTRTVNRVVEAKMAIRITGKYLRRFFKYNPQGLEAVLLLDKYQDTLTPGIYSLPEELVFSKKGEYIAFLTEYLKEYRTVYDYLRFGFYFDKDMVASNVLRVLKEMEAIGLNYYDIHDENFMLDDDGHFKVVDVDGADNLLTDKSRIITLNNFWDFILEMYLFSTDLNNQYRLNQLALFSDADTYFSREFVEYIDAVVRDDYVALGVDPARYFPEFKDKEKVLELSDRLKDNRRYEGR